MLDVDHWNKIWITEVRIQNSEFQATKGQFQPSRPLTPGFCILTSVFYILYSPFCLPVSCLQNATKLCKVLTIQAMLDCPPRSLCPCENQSLSFSSALPQASCTPRTRGSRASFPGISSR